MLGSSAVGVPEFGVALAWAYYLGGREQHHPGEGHEELVFGDPGKPGHRTTHHTQIPVTSQDPTGRRRREAGTANKRPAPSVDG